MNTNNNNINDKHQQQQQQQPPSKILLALYLWTVISLLLLGGVLLLPGCGGGGGSGNGLQLPSGATITVSSCNAQIVDTLSKMTTPSFNNSLGVPDAITHYPNIATTGESEVSYTWIGAKTTILFQWNVGSGSCIQQTSKG